MAVALGVALVLRATLGGDFSVAPMRIPAAWCLVCGPGWLMDGASNVVLFLPLGASLAWLGRPIGQTTALAALLSLTVESLQAAGIPPLRSPSLADLLTNSTGGLLGAVLVTQWPQLHAPSPVVTRRLLIGWLVVASATFAATAVALQPVSAPPAGETANGSPRRGPTVTPSPFDYAPGYGWYGGMMRSLRINGVPVPPRGEGPVVVTTPWEAETVTVALALLGRDTLPYERAMVFLHVPGDTIPYALLSQRGNDLHWQRRSVGHAWGMTSPRIRLPGALSADGAALARPRPIRAAATPGALLLATAPNRTPGEQVVSARLTAGIGWAMLQSVVALSDPLAPLVRLAWYLVLLAPIAHWSRRLGWSHVAASTLVLAGALVVTTRVGGLAIPDRMDAVSFGLAFGIGLLPLGGRWRGTTSG